MKTNLHLHIESTLKAITHPDNPELLAKALWDIEQHESTLVRNRNMSEDDSTFAGLKVLESLLLHFIEQKHS